jgi:hypothetical protein
MKWSILARHPFLRKELSFSDKDISISNARKLLRSSPLLRRLSLKGRHDTNAILRRVRRSNRLIEEIKLVGCRGSTRRCQVNGEILMRVLEGSPKLCNFAIMDTLVTSLEFYRLLARLGDGTVSFTILSAAREGLLSCP